ncbi:MAG: tetratricopeptide repeat protein [Bryobacteraceae bacterium]
MTLRLRMPYRALQIALRKLSFSIVLVAFWPSGPILAGQDPRCSPYDDDNEAAKKLLEQGRYSEAVDTLRRVVREMIRHQAEECNLASSLNNLALSYQRMGRFREAEPLVLESAQRVQASGDPTLAILTNLAVLYAEAGQFFKAKEIAKRLRASSLGPGLEYAHVLSLLGSVATGTHAYADAEQLIREALAEFAKAGEVESLNTAVLLNNLGRVRLEFDHSEEVEKYLNTAVLIMERAGGPTHPSLIGPLRNLAKLQRQRNRPADAAALLARALEISKFRLGPEHATTGKLLSEYSAMLRRAGRKSEARAAERLARRIAASGPREDSERYTVDIHDLHK